MTTVAPSSAGSSPLARGLLDKRRISFSRWGIIPARAGFTRQSPRGGGADGDHPRSRGVYGGESTCAWLPHGSSPLARGLRSQGMSVEDNVGIIPARAGFTTPRRREHPISPDHPRSRGVYRVCYSRMHITTGSSPLARGLPRPVVESIRFRRIIPARAGFTVFATHACT